MGVGMGVSMGEEYEIGTVSGDAVARGLVTTTGKGLLR